MTPTEVKSIVSTIVTDLEEVSSLAAGVDPALVPFIAIGKAVAGQLPGLSESVANWIAGNPPTDDEVTQLLQQLGVLGDPNAP
jgi:hypothetical protein